MPLLVTSVISYFHACSPVAGSMAMTAPLPAASVQVLIGPRARLGSAPPGMGGAGRPPRNSRPSSYSASCASKTEP